MGLLIAYFIYALVMGAVIFRFHTPKTSDYLKNNPVERFWGQDEEDGFSIDRVILLEDGTEAAKRRINLVENAEKRIDISYYGYHDGLSTDIFTACLLAAANRGVKVRILLDGFANLRREDLPGSIYAFTEHPNIEFKYYEPIDGLKPWTWNNRLHDKILLVDNKWVITGGRNIADKYFDKGEEARLSFDRDVFIMNTEVSSSKSALDQVTEYYDYLWNHQFSQYPIKELSTIQIREAQERTNYLAELLLGVRHTHPEMFDPSLEWMDEAIDTNKVTYIHNPITRFNKEPWVWYEITRLMEQANESIFIQSPYVIPNKRMQGYIDFEKLEGIDITVLTNSFGSNSNKLGLPGYLKFRKGIVDFVHQVYEYQGVGSLHAKSFIFDDRISMIGTFNVDPRSAFLSTKSMVVIDSEEFAEVFKKAVEDLLDQSLLVDKDYTYVEDPQVEELDSTIWKRVKMRMIYTLVYFFDYLL